MASHREIAHRWAQMNSRLFVKGYAMFADGFSIYSYGRHFEIARWVKTLASEKVRTTQDVPAMCVLFNSEGYSSSTAKHKSFTCSAIRGATWVFTLPTDCWPGDPGFETRALAHFEEKAREYFAKAGRARTWAESYRERATEALEEAQRFALAFAIRYTAPAFEELEARAAGRIKAQEKAAKAARKVATARAAERREQARVDFEDWQAGNVHFVPNEWRVAPDGSAYVRRNGDALETSQGASVPWAHALRVFAAIKHVRASGEPWARNGRTIRVGHYQVDSIDAAGNMVAGCHRFAWVQMEALAIKEGVFDAAPSTDVFEQTHA